MGLLKLPNETVHSIIETIVPESFDDIALTCKTLWHNCQPFLEKYNTLRKRFRHFKLQEVMVLLFTCITLRLFRMLR